MLPKNFSKENKASLHAILSRRRPALLATLDADTVTSEVVDELCDVLIDELSEVGLDSNDEPNSQGLEIENLIDLIRR